MQKVNPFAPNSPVNPGMFVGRLSEVGRLESRLLQTRADSPAHFLITGERGIGKSSLLNYIKWVADGSIRISGGTAALSFLVVDTDIDPSTTRIGLMEKIRLGLDSALSNSEMARSFLKDLWSFLQRVEAGGIKLRPADRDEAEELVAEKFSYTLADLVKRLTASEPDLFGSKHDGILILIDEADNASKSLALGSFLKLLSERLQRRGCSRVVFGLAGLPTVREVLRESHPSSLRLFDEISLGTLSDTEVGLVIDRCLAEADERNPYPTTTSDEARARLIVLSEGYPHFIQQFGFSAFAATPGEVIEVANVDTGAFAKGGAVDLIGDRYYRSDFYSKIQSDSYRKVLRIMAEHGKEWIKKDRIREAFKAKETTLTNAIKTLLDRKIILAKEGEPGVYRLQHRGFAWWIKLRTSDKAELVKKVGVASGAVPEPKKT